MLTLKKQQVAAHAHEPCYLPLSRLSSLLPSKFDVILVDPPFSSTFTWDTLLDVEQFPIPTLAADPSFLFLWVGSGAGDGLERGRDALAKWGYRRCEDVVWIKTNKNSNAGPGVRKENISFMYRFVWVAEYCFFDYRFFFNAYAKTDPPTTSLFTRTKQHCLIGIKGTVRRSTDSWFVHCNVGMRLILLYLSIVLLPYTQLLDTDVMIWEGDPTGTLLLLLHKLEYMVNVRLHQIQRGSPQKHTP